MKTYKIEYSFDGHGEVEVKAKKPRRSRRKSFLKASLKKRKNGVKNSNIDKDRRSKLKVVN